MRLLVKTALAASGMCLVNCVPAPLSIPVRQPAVGSQETNTGVEVSPRAVTAAASPQILVDLSTSGGLLRFLNMGTAGPMAVGGTDEFVWVTDESGTLLCQRAQGDLKCMKMDFRAVRGFRVVRLFDESTDADPVPRGDFVALCNASNRLVVVGRLDGHDEVAVIGEGTLASPVSEPIWSGKDEMVRPSGFYTPLFQGEYAFDTLVLELETLRPTTEVLRAAASGVRLSVGSDLQIESLRGEAVAVSLLSSMSGAVMAVCVEDGSDGSPPCFAHEIPKNDVGVRIVRVESSALHSAVELEWSRMDWSTGVFLGCSEVISFGREHPSPTVAGVSSATGRFSSLGLYRGELPVEFFELGRFRGSWKLTDVGVALLPLSRLEPLVLDVDFRPLDSQTRRIFQRQAGRKLGVAPIGRSAMGAASMEGRVPGGCAKLFEVGLVRTTC